VKLRYKDPDGTESRELVRHVADSDAEPSVDFVFASAVASFSLLLRDSEHRGDATFESVLSDARRSLGSDPGGFRAAFVQLVELAQGLSERERQ
jgi:Ca-activated chloride channel family protein